MQRSFSLELNRIKHYDDNKTMLLRAQLHIIRNKKNWLISSSNHTIFIPFL